jgi:putative DNA topoisomerase
MKTFIIVVITFFATFTTFAQKAKNKTPAAKPFMVQSNYICPMHHDVVSNEPGKCIKCNMDLILSKKEQIKKEVTKDYTCPMHKEVVSNMAGICSKCGKELVVVDRRSSKQGHISYICSMHPDVVADKEGECPICGMVLTKAKS